MIVRCLYASRIRMPVPAGMFDAILEQSRRNNAKRGITGLLCHTSDSFVQVVEGGRGAVSTLLKAIFSDERHHDVTMMLFGEIEERRFGNWTMGRVNMETVNPSLLLKYSETSRFDPFKCRGPAVMALLEDLTSTGSIASRSV
jgi:hypothetical protein